MKWHHKKDQSKPRWISDRSRRRWIYAHLHWASLYQHTAAEMELARLAIYTGKIEL